VSRRLLFNCPAGHGHFIGSKQAEKITKRIPCGDQFVFDFSLSTYLRDNPVRCATRIGRVNEDQGNIRFCRQILRSDAFPYRRHAVAVCIK
jgi:hypothetical protein